MILTTIQYFNIAFDTWTAIICLVAAIIIFNNRSLEPKASWTMIGVLLTDCVINVFETLGYVFDRRQGDLSVTIQYVSHFLVYAGICILTIFVAMHFGRMIEVRGLRVTKEVTVTISSYLTREAHVIEISDDGVGFDAGQPGEEDTHHSMNIRFYYFFLFLLDICWT